LFEQLVLLGEQTALSVLLRVTAVCFFHLLGYSSILEELFVIEGGDYIDK